MKFDGPLHQSLRTIGGDDVVMQADTGYLQYSLHILDVPFDIGAKRPGGSYTPRFQRGTQGTGQSPRNTSDDVVQRGRVLGSREFSAVLVLVEMSDSTMNAKVKGFRKTFDRGGPVGALMFLNPNAACMDYRHC